MPACGLAAYPPHLPRPSAPHSAPLPARFFYLAGMLPRVFCLTRLARRCISCYLSTVPNLPGLRAAMGPTVLLDMGSCRSRTVTWVAALWVPAAASTACTGSCAACLGSLLFLPCRHLMRNTAHCYHRTYTAMRYLVPACLARLPQHCSG